MTDWSPLMRNFWGSHELQRLTSLPRKKIPLRQVKSWIAEDQQKPPLQPGLIALEQMKEKYRAFCHMCGKEILNGYRVFRGKKYHPECL
jgi:hypothetical protein